MRIIPVLDLLAGRAVHAVAGDRAHYRPVRSILHPHSDPFGLALAYRDRLGASELYVADLDAISGGPPDVVLYRTLAESGLAVWVDAGLRSAAMLGPLIDAGVETVVAGLETVPSPDVLEDLLRGAGPERLVFGLDLKGGRALLADDGAWGTRDPLAIAGIAVALGVRRLLVLDLARVGTGQGLGSPGLFESLRRDHPEIEISLGGGIAGPSELETLATAGAAAVLVGSALHDDRIRSCRAFP